MSLLKVDNLKVHYPIRSGFFNRINDHVYAVDGVSFELEKGKTYGLVGESGSGKSTIGKSIVGLENITSGNIVFNGKKIDTTKVRRDMEFQKDVQVIFQDNTSSLNPKKRIYEILAEPIRNFMNLSKAEEEKRIYELLDIVSMPKNSVLKYPYQFSGGQRQRLGVARAVACKPKLIIADEPVSALDISVQAQVLNFMKHIQKEYDLSYLFISHDLGVVKHMCDHINIIHKGRFVETGNPEDIYNNPQHIYTKRLIAAIPKPDPSVRKDSIIERNKIENEYKDVEDKFYTSEGKVYDLKKITDTHFVAVDK